ncbi:hypothetical protein MLD52_08255 [Puniceicoccaceae bacterium K14]|nr:hypothetical protein [Puniceicoccaceae bacterium K14]
MNYLIKEAINRFLDDEEAFEREKQEDKDRLQHFLDTGEHISHKAMKSKIHSLLKKADKAAQ